MERNVGVVTKSYGVALTANVRWWKLYHSFSVSSYYKGMKGHNFYRGRNAVIVKTFIVFKINRIAAVLFS